MDILESIGNTPLVHLTGLSRRCGAHIHAKLETRNPGSSIKDRAAKAYIDSALASGELKPGATVIEATSGNLGIGLALVCGQMGLNLVLTMPASVSQERITLLRAMGAELVLTPADEGMGGAQARAEALLRERPGSFRPNQFENPVGPRVHYESTAVEIIRDCAALGIAVDAFVAGAGSGATVSGVGRRLKEEWPAIRVVAVEPAESPVLSGGRPGGHDIQGIGAGFVPRVFDREVMDEILTVSTGQALQAARHMLKSEAVSCGISSGANAHAAFILGSRPEFRGKNIVTVVCDTGERYLSTQLFTGQSEAE